MGVPIAFLQRVALFSGLSDTSLSAVAGTMVERAVERNELVLLDGDVDDSIYVVYSGVVKLFKASDDGRQQILHIARPGEIFNEAGIFDGGPSMTSAEAMLPAVLYSLRRTDLGHLMHDHPEIAANAGRLLAARVRSLAELIRDLSFKHVVGRLAKVLLDYAGGAGVPGVRLTQQDMAALTGTAREVVGRSLKSLADAGAIKLDHHRIVIRDSRLLRQMAGETGVTY